MMPCEQFERIPDRKIKSGPGQTDRFSPELSKQKSKEFQSVLIGREITAAVKCRF